MTITHLSSAAAVAVSALWSSRRAARPARPARAARAARRRAPRRPPARSTVSTAKTSLGTVVVDGSGRTLYLFAKDTGPKSMCAGSCAASWPPFTATAKPATSGGVPGLRADADQAQRRPAAGRHRRPPALPLPGRHVRRPAQRPGRRRLRREVVRRHPHGPDRHRGEHGLERRDGLKHGEHQLLLAQRLRLLTERAGRHGEGTERDAAFPGCAPVAPGLWSARDGGQDGAGCTVGRSCTPRRGAAPCCSSSTGWRAASRTGGR